MNTGEIRLLRADEIECRVGTINENGLSLLLYKDARVDQKILDETYGSFSWKREHQLIGDNLYCTVSVYYPGYDEWISKQDVGVPANAEKEKSAASDSFKRACVNWGIGRELYSAPFIWIDAMKAKIQPREWNGKTTYNTKEHFHVANIGYDEEKREIIAVKIANQRNEIVYAFDSSTQSLSGNIERTPESGPVGITSKQRTNLNKQLERTGVDLSVVLERYQLASLDQMSADIYKKAMVGLKATPDRTTDQAA